ncbi:hypothetical protein Prudu_1211S000400, partial [Prunus dulcis]
MASHSLGQFTEGKVRNSQKGEDATNCGPQTIQLLAKNNSSRNLEVRDVPPTNTEQHNGLSVFCVSHCQSRIAIHSDCEDRRQFTPVK